MQTTDVSPRAPRLRALTLLIALPLAAWASLGVVGADRGAAPALPSPAAVVAPVAAIARPFVDDVERARLERQRIARFFVAVWNNALVTRALQQLYEQHQQRIATWDTLARCESGGTWNVIDRFGGGLGIYIGTWQEFGGDEYASNPGYASKEQQITVAERIYARYGFSGWGCAHELGWVH